MTHSIGISRNPVLVSSAVETAILCTNIARPGHNLDINLSLGFISYLSSGLLYLFLLTIYFVGDRQGKYSKSFILLLLATLIWSVLLTLSQVGASTAFSLVTVAELLRYFTWFYLLHSAAGYYLQDKQGFRFSNPITPISVAVMFTISLATLFANDFLVELFDIANPVAIQILWNLIFSVLGLLLIEQVIRNTPASERGSIGFLCISAGAIFGYDFFVYSNAFLLQQIDYEFWSARGIVNIVVVPTLLLAAVRNPEMAPRLHVSRQFVFHSTTLIAAGGYLLLMSVVGYYVEQTSTEWGKLIQTGFLFAALLLLAVLFYTPQIKTRLKRYLSYSFRNKYDYREEWIRFSQTLLLRDPEVPIYQLAVQAIGQIVDSRGGSLWIKDSRQFIFKSSWKTSVEQTKAESEDSPMIQFIKLHREPVVDADIRRQASQENWSEHWMAQSEALWLVLPLWINDELFGFVLLDKSVVPMELTIEDFDLLNTITHHVALALFLQESDAQLQQAQRFKDLNQMTAFLVHDLKTVFSQLSLMVDNADTHKSNPAFVDDMVATVKHTTTKMERLLQQLKKPVMPDQFSRVPVVALIEQIVGQYNHHQVSVELENKLPEEVACLANQDQLYATIKHVVQNAVESIEGEGRVSIELTPGQRGHIQVIISDNGKGMTQEFIADGLFRPFESTKGVSGMGVGVYQSREYLRSLNGDIDVRSEVGVGSCFTLTLPIII